MNDIVFEIFKESVKLCKSMGINYWVVGGFAVEAKRGFISRNHGDIDFCIHEHDIKKCLKAFYKHGFKITREGLKYVLYKRGIKIDIFELFVNGDYYERKREWFTAKYPKEMFDNFQIGELDSEKFRIPSNEGLRYYGSKTAHMEDAEFTKLLSYDQRIYSRIEYHEFAEYAQAKKGVEIKELTF